jgi:hypothetical protein
MTIIRPLSLVSILSAFVHGTPPMRLADYGEQAARATRFCPRMTAPVRLWPQELANASSALGGPGAPFVRRWPARSRCELGDEVELAFDLPEQQAAGIGGDFATVKTSDDFGGTGVLEKQLLLVTLCHPRLFQAPLGGGS